MEKKNLLDINLQLFGEEDVADVEESEAVEPTEEPTEEVNEETGENEGDAAPAEQTAEDTIVVEAAEALSGEIAVFDVNGRMIAKAIAAGSRTEIQMPNAGIYIVKAGAAAERVVIK